MIGPMSNHPRRLPPIPGLEPFDPSRFPRLRKIAKNDPRLADDCFEAKLREWVFAVCVEDFDGSFSAEHAIGRKNQIFYDLYTPTGIRNLAAAFKTGASLQTLGTVRF